ncbi:alpha/beta fold hydrolase [Marisediminicola senii]|uniref:alpha/beta fold hydrolase n=1 Tax=Marisediminicola senii TaxID=2711233 RepID=UPI0013EA6E20|nr:alpha/beta hydrolase [Marisediminicola senii]
MRPLGSLHGARRRASDRLLAATTRRSGEKSRRRIVSRRSYDMVDLAEFTVATRHYAGPVGADSATVPAFVLVHGIGMSSRYFDQLAERLAQYGSVHLIDLPGYGRSATPPHDTTISDHARVVGLFVTTLGHRHPVIVGHSMGTQVVTSLLAQRPEITDRLVLIAPTIYPGRRSSMAQALSLLADMPREPFRAQWTVTTDYLFRSGIPYYLTQLPHLVGDQIEGRLASITARTLVIRGTRDPIVPLHWAENVTSLLPDATLVEVDGPHIVMAASPARVCELIVAHAR